MGKVTRIEFGGGNRGKRLEPVPGDDGEGLADQRPEREERFDIDKLTDTLFGLAGIRMRSDVPRRPDTVMARHAACQMGEWKDGELFAAINHGNESDWALRPSFYDAVIEELTRRGFMPARNG